MDAQATAPVVRIFEGLADPRRHNVRHLFTDILTLAVLGIMCRADDWTDVVAWATGFAEDLSRIRVGFGAQNFSRLRRIGINQLRNAPDKRSLKTRRYLCSLDKQYLVDRIKQ